jgi:hypothetical protein
MCEELKNGGARRWLTGSERSAMALLGVGEKWEKGGSFGRPSPFIGGAERQASGRPTHRRRRLTACCTSRGVAHAGVSCLGCYHAVV